MCLRAIYALHVSLPGRRICVALGAIQIVYVPSCTSGMPTYARSQLHRASSTSLVSAFAFSGIFGSSTQVRVQCVRRGSDAIRVPRTHF